MDDLEGTKEEINEQREDIMRTFQYFLLCWPVSAMTIYFFRNPIFQILKLNNPCFAMFIAGLSFLGLAACTEEEEMLEVLMYMIFLVSCTAAAMPIINKIVSPIPF